jgi:hypothetical protein
MRRIQRRRVGLMLALVALLVVAAEPPEAAAAKTGYSPGDFPRISSEVA